MNLRNSLIIIVRYMMAQKSDEVRGSSYLFTRPFAKKHDLAISPVAGDGYCGFYTSLKF